VAVAVVRKVETVAREVALAAVVNLAHQR